MEKVVLVGPDKREYELEPGQALEVFKDDDGKVVRCRVQKVKKRDGAQVETDWEYGKLLYDMTEGIRSGNIAQENMTKAIGELVQHQKRHGRISDPLDDPMMDSLDARNYGELIEEPATNDWARAVQRAHDKLYVRAQARTMRALARKEGIPHIRSMPEFKRWAHVIQNGPMDVKDEDVDSLVTRQWGPVVRMAAMERAAGAWDPNTVGAGQELTAVGVSRTFMSVHRLMADSVSAFQRIEIPRGVRMLEIPTFTSVAAVRVVAATGAGATGGPWAPQGTQTPNNPTTASMILNPKKHATDPIAINVEESEDATIAVVDAGSAESFLAMAHAWESAVFNGQANNDGTLDGANGPLPANNYAQSATVNIGIRRFCFANPTTHTQDAGGGDATITDFENWWEKMGRFGITGQNRVAAFFSPSLFYDMVRDANIRSADIAGPIATLPNGALTRLYGIPIYITGEYPAVDATGKVNATPANNTFSTACMVNLDRWKIGVARDVELRVLEPALEDVIQMRAFARHAIAYAPPATDTIAVTLYNFDL